MHVAIDPVTRLSFRQAFLAAIIEVDPDAYEDEKDYLRALFAHPALAPFELDDYWLVDGFHLFVLWKTVVHYQSVARQLQKGS